MSGWYDVNKEGLSKLVEKHGKGRLIAELVQNALDEQVSRIDITLDIIPGRPYANLIVADDSPVGFVDLSHAYTLFAESYKKKEPEKRGRFNLGEKLVLAMCEEATISSTTGTVNFLLDGTKEVQKKKKTAWNYIFRKN